jgi:hypothetical protein
MAAYLDDRKKVNMWIVAMTIPAILFIIKQVLESTAALADSGLLNALHEMPLIDGLAAISPLFALIQISMIVRGTASATWQNILCVVVTIAGAVMVWQQSTGGIG